MKPKILMVDDSRMIRLLVSRVLRPFDCEVLEAANGFEGLAVVARENPSLILLDLTMPMMDGLEMLTRLRHDQGFKPVPVMMLTADSSRETVLKSVRLGIEDYVPKPVSETTLLLRIQRLVPLQPRPEGQLANGDGGPFGYRNGSIPHTSLTGGLRPAIWPQF